MAAQLPRCQELHESIGKIISEAAQGLKLAKCRKCGCMQDALNALSALAIPKSLGPRVASWLLRMEPIEYHCLGCEHCYPAVMMNVMHQAFPEQSASLPLACAFTVQEHTWPPVPGEYFVCAAGSAVAVSTLANGVLAEQLALIKPPGLCIVGKTETENIGIDKIIKNTIANPAIRFLLLVGPDSLGHLSGQTLLALGANGVDDRLRVLGSPGRRPILANVSFEEVAAFRSQVTLVNMIGCEEVEQIVLKIAELGREQYSACACAGCGAEKLKPTRSPLVINAEDVGKKILDKAGYFVIIPQSHQQTIIVEHYSYDNVLLRVIEGHDARAICGTILENGWVTELSHAAYLGRELARAQLSLEKGEKYVQDGA